MCGFKTTQSDTNSALEKCPCAGKRLSTRPSEDFHPIRGRGPVASQLFSLSRHRPNTSVKPLKDNDILDFS